MTIEEYAAWCGEFEAENEGMQETWGEVVEMSKDSVNAHQSVTPPDTLKEFHSLRRAASQSLRDFADKHPSREAFNPFALMSEPGIMAAGFSIQAVVDELPTDVVGTLEAAGCE